MAAGKLADRLPGVFVQYLPGEPICRIYINPVYHAMIDAPERLVPILDRSRESLYLCLPEIDPEQGDQTQMLRRMGYKVEQGKQGVLHLDISRYMAEQWGILEGHHIAWADERDHYIAFPLSVIPSEEQRDARPSEVVAVQESR